MEYKAVVFDLFGTLVDADGDRWDQMFKDMSNSWGVPLEEFKQPWIASGVERDMGGFQSMEEQLAYLCIGLDYSPPAKLLDHAKTDYVEMRRQSLQPRSGTIETLQKLKFMGLLRGLVSNCSFVDRDLWPACEIAPHIDVSVLSPEVRLMNPFDAYSSLPALVLVSNRRNVCTLVTTVVVNSPPQRHSACIRF